MTPSEPAVATSEVVAAAPGQAESSAPALTTGVFSREAELEKQLEKTHSELIAVRREKSALEASVSELQDRLTEAETNGTSAMALKQDNIGTMEANIRRGEREKDLEKQLVKVKREKDKALRLIISLIGKVMCDCRSYCADFLSSCPFIYVAFRTVLPSISNSMPAHRTC